LAEPRSYAEILDRGYLLGRDFRIEFGDSKIDQVLLAAPHGGGIEPGTSEILRAVANMGGWAWYEFAGFLRGGNKDALHISSTLFDEPTLERLLPQTAFVVAFHGASTSEDPVVYIGGRWKLGKETLIEAINAAGKDHEIRAVDAMAHPDSEHLQGLDPNNVTNRGRFGEGIQLEFSRGARNRLFPPNASREARGKRSKLLRPLARSIQFGIEQLCRSARQRSKQA
jgi:phage replication-related protein YjqB (UPF0714/DUF867 family)